MNAALYDFIDKRNALEESIGELEQKETRMVMEGNDLEEIHAQLMVEGDSLMKAMNQYVKTFISDNYENVLGPSVFMMLCSSLPYPIMTPQIDDIIKDAPYSFKDNKLSKACVSSSPINAFSLTNMSFIYSIKETTNDGSSAKSISLIA